jgi:hypothetical protein
MSTDREIVIEKLTSISQNIKEISEYDEGLANLIWIGFDTAMSLAQSISENNEKKEQIDISVYIQQICDALGVDIEQMVLSIIQNNNTQESSNKEPDLETLDFITSDLDDYEKFLAKSSAKNNLDFLSKEI